MQQEKLRKGAAAARGAQVPRMKSKQREGHNYVKRSGYGDVELVMISESKPQRKSQLRAAGSWDMATLPTALLAVSKNRTLEVRLDTFAQFSIADDDLR
ncbi:unnamed protein product [Phytophthora fragariaefolia]|uniref:Unnamed protein product n=1 Tax=Phytophthora fragariaefolia TaxID=1490495 RepID=A0A9W6XXN7_9STRA|nr:unnamed protein product [Phytophthora fragariaefolia]